VGVGTDVAYVSRNDPGERAKVPRRPAAPATAGRWEHLWPADGFRRPADPHAAASLAWTNWPLFTVGLVQRGHSEAAVRKIVGGNVLRVWRANHV
jgi:membrane dipeptidase